MRDHDRLSSSRETLETYCDDDQTDWIRAAETMQDVLYPKHTTCGKVNQLSAFIILSAWVNIVYIKVG